MIDQHSAFTSALKDHLESISLRNIDQFAHTLHHDVRLVGPTGSIIHGYDDAVAAHRGWFIEGGWVFESSILWTQERDDSAWALTSIRYSTAQGLTRFLLFLLFVRDGGDWKLIYDQNTPFTNTNP